MDNQHCCKVLLHEELAYLRSECDTLVALCQRKCDLVEHAGCIVEPKTYGLRNAPSQFFVDLKLLFMQICSQLLVENVPVQELNEQYIVKPPGYAEKTGFVWHRVRRSAELGFSSIVYTNVLYY